MDTANDEEGTVTDYYDPNRPPPDEPFDPYEGLLDLSGGEPIPPLEDPRLPPAGPPRSPLLTGLILGLLLVVLSIALFQFARGDDTAAGPTETTAPGDTVAGDGGTTVAGSETTAPDDGSTTSSTTLPSSGQPYVAAGDPIPIEDLTLQVDGIGEVKLGQPAAEAIGRLIASLGEPDSDSGNIVSSGTYGACTGDAVRIVTWGPLAAVVLVDDDGTETFAGYRVDWDIPTTAGGTLADSPASDLATLSGLQVGNSVRELKTIYNGFNIDFVDDPQLHTTFELRGANTDNLLLWGPVTADTDAGIVTGIYSPNACEHFSLNG